MPRQRRATRVMALAVAAIAVAVVAAAAWLAYRHGVIAWISGG